MACNKQFPWFNQLKDLWLDHPVNDNHLIFNSKSMVNLDILTSEGDHSAKESDVDSSNEDIEGRKGTGKGNESDEESEEDEDEAPPKKKKCVSMLNADTTSEDPTLMDVMEVVTKPVTKVIESYRHLSVLIS